MQNGSMKRGLLLAGDTCLKGCSSDDKSTYPLFGDAGSVTALEFKENANRLLCCFNTDGAGIEHIIVRDGGFRSPFKINLLYRTTYEEGGECNNMKLELSDLINI